MTQSSLIPNIANWLYRQALQAADADETVGGLGRRLLAGGVPVCRLNVGAMLFHPVLGALDITWDDRSNSVRSHMVPPGIRRL